MHYAPSAALQIIKLVCVLLLPEKNFLPVYHLKCEICHPALQIVKLVCVLPLPGKNIRPVYHLKSDLCHPALQLGDF